MRWEYHPSITFTAFMWNTFNSITVFWFPSHTYPAHSNGGLITLFIFVSMRVSRCRLASIGCNFPTWTVPFIDYFLHMCVPLIILRELKSKIMAIDPRSVAPRLSISTWSLPLLRCSRCISLQHASWHFLGVSTSLKIPSLLQSASAVPIE